MSMHTDNVLGGPIDSRGRPQPEEYANHVHETALAQIESRPYLFATWLWNSFDFATTIRAEGDAQDISTKGLVTYDRSVKKDAFYLYKANRSDQPTVHIVGRRYATRAYPTTDIKVYSNAASTGSDHYFTGGTARTIDKPADLGKPAVPIPIAGSPARDAIVTFREGNFAYRIPMPRGRYRLRLWFTLPAEVQDMRFDVLAGGKSVQSSIGRAPGTAALVAVSRDADIRSDGTIDLKFQSQSDKAMASLIEIMPLP